MRKESSCAILKEKELLSITTTIKKLSTFLKQHLIVDSIPTSASKSAKCIVLSSSYHADMESFKCGCYNVFVYLIMPPSKLHVLPWMTGNAGCTSRCKHPKVSSHAGHTKWQHTPLKIYSDIYKSKLLCVPKQVL